MPPVINLSPRTLPRAVAPNAGMRGIQAGAQTLLAEDVRQKQMGFEEEQAAKDRQQQRELAELRAEVQRDVSGTFDERSALQRDVRGTFDERARQQLGTIEARGRQARLTDEAGFNLRAPVREREFGLQERSLGIREGALDLRALQGTRDFNLGLAQINQRAEANRIRATSGADAFPLRGLAGAVGRTSFDPFDPPSTRQIQGLMGIAAGRPESAALVAEDAPPGQGGVSQTDLDRTDFTGPGGIGTGGGGGIDLDVPEQVNPQAEIQFMRNFLSTDEERQLYLETLPPAARVQVLRHLGAEGAR